MKQILVGSIASRQIPQQGSLPGYGPVISAVGPSCDAGSKFVLGTSSFDMFSIGLFGEAINEDEKEEKRESVADPGFIPVMSYNSVVPIACFAQ